MKLNNKKIKDRVLVFYAISILLLSIFILLKLNLLDFGINNQEYYILSFLGIFLLIFANIGMHFYQFDTSGEGLTLIVKRIDPFSFLSSKEKKVDLPKYKLDHYEYKKGLLNDTITLFINSKRGASIIKVKMKLSILSKDHPSIICSELDKIVSSNRTNTDIKVA